jgi:hypothetical protein
MEMRKENVEQVGVCWGARRSRSCKKLKLESLPEKLAWMAASKFVSNLT